MDTTRFTELFGHRGSTSIAEEHCNIFPSIHNPSVAMPCGRFAVFDPIVIESDRIPFRRMFSPGDYEIKMSLVSGETYGDGVAAAAIFFGNTTPVTWEPALPNREVTAANDTICFADGDSFLRYKRFSEAKRLMMWEESQRRAGTHDDSKDVAWEELAFGRELGANFVMCQCEPGVLPCAFGLDAANNVVCFVVDYLLID